MRASALSTTARRRLAVLAVALALSAWLSLGLAQADRQSFSHGPAAGLQLADPSGGKGTGG